MKIEGNCMNQLASFMLIIFVFFMSCSTTSKISTSPSSVETIHQGKSKGQTPVSIELSNFIAEKHVIIFKKDDVILKKVELDRKVNWMTIILSPLGLGIPLLWLSGSNDEYFFDLQILNWSDQFEAKNFESADKKCNSIGYRLPTDLEMKFAYESGLTRKWGIPTNLYWTSTRIADGVYYKLDSALASNQFAQELYYTFNAENGVFGKSNPNNQYLIRCVK
jgi:hypothetical protein